MIGELVGGRWEVVAKAGAGGMGVVYRATDRETGQPAALKVMAQEVWAADRFWQEAEVLEELAHPAVVRYLGRGHTQSGQPYLAMEWLDGVDLDERLRQGALGIAETLAIARRVVGALEAAHGRGVVHRDLKPSNLFLVGADATRIKLLDFGIARVAVRTNPMTQTGAMLGTIGYMAPEQASGARDVDGRADLFSLGCVLYECLAGTPAFSGAQLIAVLAKVLREDPQDLATLRRDVPPELAELVTRLLAKRREERPPTAAAVREALEGVDANDAMGATHPGPPVLVRRGEQRLVSVLMVDASEGIAEQATVHPEELAEEAARAGAIAEKYSGDAVMLARHCMLVTLTATGSVTDQVLRAAACALELGAAYPSAAVALATGRAESTGRTPVGPVIERAASLLEGAAGTVVLDELTARFAEARFEVRADGARLRLVGVRADPEEQEARRLLGKTTPCVGRRKELALLEATLEECIEERVPRVVVVTAQAGMGKTRLRRELVHRVRKMGTDVRILRARGELIAAASSMALARQLLRAAIGAPEGMAADDVRERIEARVNEVVPEHDCADTREFLSELLGVSEPDSSSDVLRVARDDPRVIAERLKQSFATWLAAEATRSPLLLILDDLHWVDDASLRYIDAALKRAPMMVLGLGRPDDSERFADLGVHVGRQDVRLQPLSGKAASELVRGALPGEVSDETVRRIVERADGNAFYLEELIRHVAEGGGDELPATVVAMAQSRIDRLEPDARQVLQAASVFGETFHDGGVAGLLGNGAQLESTREWLTTLVDRELLTERHESRFAEQRELTFRHGLLREAAYGMLTDANRTVCHRLAGEWLERVGEPDPVVLASHFERGDDGERAVRYLAAAARDAAAMYAHDRAAALLQRGLALVSQRPSSPRRDREELALLFAQVPSLRAVHGYTDRALLAVLERARVLAESLDDAQALFQALRNLWGLQFVAGDLKGTLEIANKLAELASVLPDLEAESQHALAGSLTHAGQLGNAIHHFERSRRHQDESDSQDFGWDLSVFNSAWEAHALWLYGLEDRAVTSANEAVRTARVLGHAYSEALAHAYAAVLHYMRSDRRACGEAAGAARDLCQRHGFAYYGHWGTILGAWAGEKDDPVGAMRGALASLDAEGSWARRPIYLAALAEVLAAAGRRGEALEALDQAEDRVASSGDRLWSAELLRLRAELVPDQSLVHARRALELARALCARPLVVRCAVTLAEAMRRDGLRSGNLVRDALAALPDGGSSFDRSRALKFLQKLD